MDLQRLKSKVNPEHTALVIIDMQKDYLCEGGVLDKKGFDLEASKLLVPRLNGFLNKVRSSLKFIVHFRMTLIPYLRSPAMIEQFDVRAGLKRDYSPEYREFHGVIPIEGEVVIDKCRYSGFVSTWFDRFLRSNGIKALVLTGVATNVCVESTARDGFMRDYHIVIPRDLTEGVTTEAKTHSLLTVDAFFGEVVDSKELLFCWGIED